MRRNVARIGVVAAIALSMSVATMTAPSTRAEDAPSLVAPARSSAGLMNYAINLSQLSDENAMARVIELLPSVGGTLLTQYPGLHTVFAQSESASFSPDLDAVLREHGIAVHSIGPTRVAAVPESERATNQTPPAAPGSAPAAAPAAAPTGLTVPDPNVPDPFPTTNWGAEAMDARGAAEVEVPHAPVTVGVIDTGIDAEQPDLAGRVDTSRSVSCDVNGIPNVSEEALRYNDIHGTHIAGIIAANHNDIGIDGIAPDATLVSIKAVNDKGRLYPEYLVCAYDWAVNHGVDIVHNSFQMDPWRFWKSDDPEQAAGMEAALRAIYTAQERGLTVLSGAGDDGLDLDETTVDSSSPTDSTPIENRNVEGATMVPAMVGGVAMVSALEMATPGAEPLRATLKRTDTSNYGFMRVDFAAPGRDIYSTFPNLMIPSNYGYMSGTAVAAAHVSGVAALVKSTHPALVGEQITDLMRKQGAYEYGRLALPADNHEYRGRGFLSARNAVVYDQAQPTLGMVEYRVGGGEWTNLRDEVVPAGRVSVRVSARSPLSMLSVDVAGVAQAHAPGGGGYFDEPTTVTVDDVDLASLIPEGEEYVTARVQVSALGINADRHADDDVSRSVSFTVARDPGAVPAPEPEPDPGEGSGVVPVDPVPPGIMSVPRTSAQMPQNYAVNLAADADEATFQRALYQASLLGGMVLESYPALRTFFVQSSSAAFAMDLGYALADSGISFHSVGPTRQAPVVGNEAIVSQELGAPAYPSVEEKPPVPEGPHVGGVYPTPPDAKDWHLQAVGALDAQGVDVMRAPVTVGVMGDGVDDTVGDLSGKVDHSLSVSCNSNGMPNRDPEAWRSGSAEVGTQAAGVIAGTGEASGVPGVNPTLNVAAINVASPTTGQYYPEYVVCGFVWAADHGISVTASNYLVSPWKYWMPRDPEQAAGLEAVHRGINYAASKDVVNVVDAGASGIDLNNPPKTDASSPIDAWAPFQRDTLGGVMVPAMMPNALAVSTLRLVDQADPGTGALEHAWTSNWGITSVAFTAPGENVFTTRPTWLGGEAGVARDASMAAPVAAGAIATLRQVHPEMGSAQIVELARKQAGSASNWGRLAAPEGEREYRGAGMPSVLDAVLKDQARPVVGEVEYSADGSTWAPLSGQSVSGRVSLRVGVTGPVTSARLLVGGHEVATVQGSGEFSGSGVTLQADGVDVSHPVAGASLSGETTVRVEAFGRNNDARADDDVSAEVTVTVEGSGSGGSSVDEAGAGRWVYSRFGKWWRFTDGTFPVNVRLRIDGKIYRFGPRGYVVTGWYREGDQWSYYGLDGAQALGWARIRGTWYYFDPSSGAMRTGWLTEGGYTYYLSSSGAMVTGPRWIDGKRYVFDRSGHLLT